MNLVAFFSTFLPGEDQVYDDDDADQDVCLSLSIHIYLLPGKSLATSPPVAAFMDYR